MKKSIFRIIIEAMAFGGFKNAKLPLDKVKYKRLSVDKIKSHIMEEFAKAKEVSDEKVEEKPWEDAEIENEIEWMKKLNIKEFFIKKGEK